MATPEGKVKAKLRKLLAAYEPYMYTYWPVPSGFGKSPLDVIGCYRGRYFTVETKAEGKKPTLRQAEEINSVERAMGKSFVISGVDSPVFEELRAWLNLLNLSVPNDTYITPDQIRRRPV